MSILKYSVNHHYIQAVLSWILTINTVFYKDFFIGVKADK
jgi:hypothetical protein